MSRSRSQRPFFCSTHASRHALAEKYDVPSLKNLAQTKFEMAVTCYHDSSEYADTVEEVYCSTIDTDRGLRDIVPQKFRAHPSLATTQDIYAVIEETPTLALDLYRAERGIPVNVVVQKTPFENRVTSSHPSPKSTTSSISTPTKTMFDAKTSLAGGPQRHIAARRGA